MTDEDGRRQVAEFRDSWYETAKAAGLNPNMVGVFDKRMLLPMSRLPEIVMTETGEELPPGRLEEIVEAGWVPALTIEESGEPGFALYAPTRVGLFLKLEQQGYGAAELRAIAAYEEGYIDNVLVNEDTPYLDDDRELLLIEWRTQVVDAEIRLEHVRAGHRPWTDNDTEAGLEEEITRTRRSIEFLEQRPLETMKPELREKTERMAYQVRFFHEIIRAQLHDHLRSQVKAGYSPFLHFRRISFSSDELPSFQGVMWDVLENPWVGEEGVPIRLPKILLNGDQVVQLRPLRPSEYEELWERYDLDQYFHLLAGQRGERRCPGCHKKLPEATHQLRQYCSPACRASARMRRFRDRQRQGERPSFPWEEFE